MIQARKILDKRRLCLIWLLCLLFCLPPLQTHYSLLLSGREVSFTPPRAKTAKIKEIPLQMTDVNAHKTHKPAHAKKNPFISLRCMCAYIRLEQNLNHGGISHMKVTKEIEQKLKAISQG